MSISNVSKHFGYCKPTIAKVLDKYGIERYKKARVYNPNLKEDFFHNITSEQQAYFLGFIITDGNVFIPEGGRQASISITQQENDRYILDYFLECVNANTRVGYDNRGCCQAAIRSDEMAKDLEAYGVTQNKTLSTTLPKLENYLMPHLIRGIFDGDGSIKAHMTNKNNRYAHAISFSGTHVLMQEIVDYLSTQLMVFKPTVYDYDNRNLSETKWQSINDIYIIGEWMYKNATIYLKRKYESYLLFKNHYNL